MGNQVRWTGRVVSGLGSAGPATSLDWFRASLKQLWGFEPVPGTLNVIVEDDRQALERILLTASTVLVPPTPDLCCALLAPARIAAGPRSASVVMFRPMVHGYNPAQLEFLAPVQLREALSLQDGDEVSICAADAPPTQKWFAPAGAGGGAGSRAEPNMPGVQTGQARITVDLSTGPLECQVLWAITEQGVSVSLFGGVPHVGSTVLAVPRPSLKDPNRRSATSSVLNAAGHKDDELARPLAERLAAGLNRVAAVTAGVHAGPPGVHKTPPEDLKRIVDIVGRVDEIIRMAAGKGSV